MSREAGMFWKKLGEKNRIRIMLYETLLFSKNVEAAAGNYLIATKDAVHKA